MPEPTLTIEEINDLRVDLQHGFITPEQVKTLPQLVQAQMLGTAGPLPQLGPTFPTSKLTVGLSETMTQPRSLLDVGRFESGAALPANIAALWPPARLASIPAAGILGGLGAGVDAWKAGRGLDLESMLEGLLRQGGLAAVGGGLSGPVARVAMRGAVPRASRAGIEAALQPRAWWNPLPVGTSVPAARASAQRAGQAITTRAASIPGTRPRSALFTETPEIINKTVGRSMQEETTLKQMLDEVEAMRGQGPQQLSVADLLEKKRGAREGFEALQRTRIKGMPVSPPTRLEESIGNVAQRLTEEMDLARPHRRPWQPSLKQLNQVSGGYQNLLQELLLHEKDVGAGLKRFFQGGVVGGAPGAALDVIRGDRVDLNRYGAPALLSGATYAMAPSLVASLLRLSGEGLPVLANAANVSRRTPQRAPRRIAGSQ